MLCLLKLLSIYFGNVISTNISSTPSSDINKNAIKTNASINTIQLNDDSVLDYFYGNDSDDEENQSDNLLSMVDMATAKKFLQLANKRNLNSNYTELNKAIARERLRSIEAAQNVPFFIKKALDLMKQSIYSTRYRLQDTRELRKDYSDDICYNVAIFYGSLMQLRIKMDNVYATMMKLPYDIKFIWFVGLYERCLAMHVDITYMVEAMFKLKEMDIIDLGSFEKGQG